VGQDHEGGLLPFGKLGTVAYCVVLFLLFLFLGFPFDRVGDRLVTALSSASGAEIDFTDLSPYLSIAGPGFEAANVRVVGSDGTRLDFDRMRVRPAWSLAWLRLAPALHLDVEGPLGRVAGTAVVDRATPGFDGVVEGVNLGRVPVDALLPDLTVTGTLDADVDLSMSEGAPGPDGRVVFEARDGGISGAGIPMGVPYETLTGELELGGEALVRILSLEARGPMINVDASGEIGLNEYFVEAPMDIDLRIDAKPRFVRSLSSLGLRPGADGAITAKISGTPNDPVVQ
jgi:type II secretion system protein N